MANGLIIYFSQSGSTKNVAERITNGIMQRGHTAELVSLSQADTLDTRTYDFLGIGSPTYIFRPAYNVLDYLDTLDNLAGKPVFAFVTYGTEIGDGGNWLRRKLAQKKTVGLGYFTCRGTNYFPGYTRQRYLFSPEHPTSHELAAAETFGRDLGVKLTQQEFNGAAVYDQSTHAVLRLERFLTNRFLIKHLYRRCFSVKQSRCRSCGGCVAACPVKNLTLGKNGRPQWGSNCILCLQCEIACPHKAIVSPVAWLIFRPFMVYNIWRASRIKRVDFTKLSATQA